MVNLKKEVAVAKHRPVAILIDRSASTFNIRDGLNRITEQALKKMKSLVEFRNITELLVIQFDTHPEVTAEFTRLDRTPAHALTIAQCDHCTDTGAALELALKLLDQRKKEYGANGEEYFQPVCFLLTDGKPDPGDGAPAHVVRDYEERYARAAEEIKKREAEKKLTFVAAGIYLEDGDRADMKKLRELSDHPDRIVELHATTNDLSKIEKYFEVILQATNIQNDTSIDALMHNMFGVDESWS